MSKRALVITGSSSCLFLPLPYARHRNRQRNSLGFLSWSGGVGGQPQIRRSFSAGLSRWADKVESGVWTVSRNPTWICGHLRGALLKPTSCGPTAVCYWY